MRRTSGKLPERLERSRPRREPPGAVTRTTSAWPVLRPSRTTRWRRIALAASPGRRRAALRRSAQPRDGVRGSRSRGRVVSQHRSMSSTSSQRPARWKPSPRPVRRRRERVLELVAVVEGRLRRDGRLELEAESPPIRAERVARPASPSPRAAPRTRDPGSGSRRSAGKCAQGASTRSALRLEHLDRARLGVAALHLRDPGAHACRPGARGGRRRRSRSAARRRCRRRRASRSRARAPGPSGAAAAIVLLLQGGDDAPCGCAGRRTRRRRCPARCRARGRRSSSGIEDLRARRARREHGRARWPVGLVVLPRPVVVDDVARAPSRSRSPSAGSIVLVDRDPGRRVRDVDERGRGVRRPAERLRTWLGDVEDLGLALGA